MSKQKTESGKKLNRLLAIFIVLIFVFSFIAKILQSNFGDVRVEHIMLDVRGAQIDGELYYPAGTNSKDRLPAVVVAHGGGLNYGTQKGSASELARRGFVVLNISAYGSALSTMPQYDESGSGVEGYSVFNAAAGVLDAVNYVRSLTFVDAARVGLLGQSMGSNRAGVVAIEDCGYYNFNDIMINVLYDQFGEIFTEEEITEDADILAETRLNADELKHYEMLREANWEKFNTRIKSVMVVGLNWLPPLSNAAEVEVAGHTVVRNLQSNVAYGTGALDVWASLDADELLRETWYSSEYLTHDAWYVLDDTQQTSTIVGEFEKDSVTASEPLKEAIASGRARVLCEPVKNVTHTAIFASKGLFSQQVKFFEQTLGYNRGDLGTSGTKPLDSSNILSSWREACNGIAMVCMLGMVITLACLLLRLNVFQSCIAKETETAAETVLGKRYWISAACTIVFTFLSIFITNRYLSNFQFAGKFQNIKAMPFGQITIICIAFTVLLSIGTLMIVTANVLINRKTTGKTGLEQLHFAIGVKNIAKCLLIAVICLAAAYMSLGIISYFFGQDYRWFTTNFTYVRPEYWMAVIPTAAIYFVLYLILGVGINLFSLSKYSDSLDTVLTVIINSLGIWLAGIMNELSGIIAGANGAFVSSQGKVISDGGTSFLCDFFNTYHLLILVPVVVLISRIMYKRTKSIWLGAILAALIVSWAAVACGVNDIYHGISALGSLLG